MQGGNVVEIRETPAWRHAAYARLVIRQSANPDAEIFMERTRTFAPGKRVLEFGCGAGGLAIPFAESGFTVTGIDANPDVLDALTAVVRRQGLTISCHRGLIEEVILNEKFDAVIIASVLINAGDSEYRGRLLRKAADHLVPGGLLVIEYCNATFFSETGELLLDEQDLVCRGRSSTRWVGDIRYKFPDTTIIVPAVFHLADEEALTAEAAAAQFDPVGERLSLNAAANVRQFRRRADQ